MRLPAIARMPVVFALCLSFASFIGITHAHPVAPSSAVVAPPNQRPEVIRLQLLLDGSSRDGVTHLYKPNGAGPFPLVIYSHGRAGTPVERSKLQFPVPVGHANRSEERRVGKECW